MKPKKCTTCKKKLAGQNRCGYCVKCFRKSDVYREYQRKYHLKYSRTPERRAISRAYNQTPERKKANLEQNRRYCKDHPDRVKEYQRRHKEKVAQFKPIVHKDRFVEDDVIAKFPIKSELNKQNPKVTNK